MATIHHQVWIKAPAGKVYEAVGNAEGLGRWWASLTSANTPGGIILSHNPGREHGAVKRIVLDSGLF